MIYKALVFLMIIFTFTGCFRFGSSTKIEILNVTALEYEKIKKDVLKIITKLDLPLDCEYDKDYWKANRENGQLICRDKLGNNLYTKNKNNNVSIIYSSEYNFLVPTKELVMKEIITKEHKVMQEKLLDLALKYKHIYQNVKVVFYHSDLPKEGKRLL